MTDNASPVLINDIPDQIFYAGIDNTLELKGFIANSDDAHGDLSFYVTLADGQPLPAGVSCSPEGVLQGKPRFDIVSGEPYSMLVVAKNNADIPLVVYFALTVTEPNQEMLTSRGLSAEDVTVMVGGDADGVMGDLRDDAVSEVLEMQEDEDFSYVDKEFEEFLESLNAEDLVKDPNLVEKAFGDQAKFSNELNDPEYLAFVIRYFIRKFSSLQVYNADETFNELDILNIYEATTGWKVYDSDFALTTTNPEPFSSDFSRSEFIGTVKEMIQLAAQRGWKTIGVKGCDRELGYRLVLEYNQLAEPELRLNVDNYTDFSSWHERAETQRFTKHYESR